MSTEAQQELTRYQELREVLENLMLWQVKNVRVWNNGAYDQASMVIKRHDTALQKALAEQPSQQEPGRNHWEDGDVFERIAAIKEQPAQPQHDSLPNGLTEAETSATASVAGLLRKPAQPQQKPVAWMHTNAIGHVYFRKNPQDKTLNPVPLYTSPPAQQQDFSDAYQGAREDLAIWKKRALEAEELNRKFIADINGQTFMGEPAQQEPVATLWQHGETGRTRITMPGDITDCDARWFKAADLYTSPPTRKPLTDKEIDAINVRLAGSRDLSRLFARAIEAAHGIKGDA